MYKLRSLITRKYEMSKYFFFFLKNNNKLNKLTYDWKPKKNKKQTNKKNKKSFNDKEK